jgi:hypothetical protein
MVSQPRIFAFTRFTTHLLLYHTTTMPSSRQIDLGHPPGSHVTPSKRNENVGMSLAGATPKEISSVTKSPLQTIRSNIILKPKRSKGFSLFGHGMKQTYEYIFERNLRFVRTNRKATYQKVRDDLDTTLTNRSSAESLRNMVLRTGA